MLEKLHDHIFMKNILIFKTLYETKNYLKTESSLLWPLLGSLLPQGIHESIFFQVPHQKEVAGLQEDNFRKAVVFSSLGAREAQAE